MNEVGARLNLRMSGTLVCKGKAGEVLNSAKDRAAFSAGRIQRTPSTRLMG